MPTSRRQLINKSDHDKDTVSSAGSETDDYGKDSVASSDTDALSSAGSSDEEGAGRSRPPRRRSWVVPVLLVLGIVAAAALAYYFYSRSLTIASPNTTSEPGELDPTSATAAAAAAAAESLASTRGTSASKDSHGAGTSENAGTARPITASTPHVTTGSTSSTKETQSDTPSPSTSAGRTTETKTGSTSSRSAGKKGAGYNRADYTLKLKLAWAYNWASTPGGSLEYGVMYIPQLWGAKAVSTWKADAEAAIKAGATHLLGFNEPDLAEQANLSPSQAAELWKSEIEQFAGKVKLVSPAVSNGVKTADGKNMGVPWLLDFVAACDGCTIDAFALHWYESTSNTAYFTSYLSNASAELKKPIWLTEFMGTGTPADQKTFLEFAVPWLEKQPFIERYAAFGDFADNPIANFVKADGSLTELGDAYAAF
ncbi:hypothetical protein BMF94_3228 [Rhodotorula taiwanensis]|uniref:Asl1-like glycosyl hydrolase catalytic domain-containing protein n=1 Tax=Rhodotorula taiwanensis TaxID=741276 RepID=A0A2S5BAD8_9BASI|nr:hypothetical protein BMF94_3228 [Rhodotorula taiwanensis]